MKANIYSSIPGPRVMKSSKRIGNIPLKQSVEKTADIMWKDFQPPCPVLSACSILWLIVNALRGKWMWSWLFTAGETVGVIMIKNKKCQQLIWYMATWLSDRLAYNPTGVTLPRSLLAKCQRPTWLLSRTVWYPQAALRDSTEVPRFKHTFSVSLKPNVQCGSVCLNEVRLRTSDTSRLFLWRPTTHFHKQLIRIRDTTLQLPRAL